MTTATLETEAKPDVATVDVYERLMPAPESRVDTDRQLIKGVKVVGIRSRNPARVIGMPSDDPYVYSLEALKKALPLYEGVPVNIDHPRFRYQSDGSRDVADGNRDADDRFGRLVNVRLVESGEDAGIYADLEYLSNHPMASRIIEAAQRMPDIFALSHHAKTLPRMRENGKVVIEEIVEVESVDLIGEKPGTTQSLFESLSKTAEAEMPQDVLPTKDDKPTNVAEQTEEEVLNGEPPPEETSEMEDVPSASPKEEVKSALRSMVMSVFDDETLDAKATLEKIRKILQTQDDLLGGDSETEVAEQEEEEEETDTTEMGDHDKRHTTEQAGEDTPTKPKAEPAASTESLARIRKLERENESLKRKERARATLESAEVAATNHRIEALAGVKVKEVQEALISDWEAADKANSGGQPRSRAPKPVIESKSTVESRQQNNEGDYDSLLRGLGTRPMPQHTQN